MYDLIILTAAVSRPDLHKQIFLRNLQFVDGLHVKWLINIDYINNDYSINDTIETFKQLFSGATNIDAEYLYSEGASCFFSAAKRLASRAYELLPECRTGVLWLEDDWVINGKTVFSDFLSGLRLRNTRTLWNKKLIPCAGTLKQKQLILETQGYTDDSLWYVSLVPRVGVSFNPGIWSKLMFMQGFYEKLISIPENQIDDPETLCADPYNKESAYENVIILADPIFQDAGRRWIAEIGLEKWQKKHSALIKQGAVTYNTEQLTVSALNEENVELLTGYFLMPGLPFSSPLRLVAETIYEEGKLKAQLLAMPFLSFELRVSESSKTDVYMNRMHAWAQIYPFKKIPVSINWHFDKTTKLLDTVEVKSPLKNFVAKYTKRIPLCSIWMIPIQAIAGVVIYIITLIRITNSLEKR